MPRSPQAVVVDLILIKTCKWMWSRPLNHALPPFCWFLCLSCPNCMIVQDTAARLITAARKWAQISHVGYIALARFRTEFKVLSFVFNAIHGVSLRYTFSVLLQPYTTFWSCRSASQQSLFICQARLKSRGDRFPPCCTRLWHALLLPLRLSLTIHTLKYFCSLAFSLVLF